MPPLLLSLRVTRVRLTAAGRLLALITGLLLASKVTAAPTLADAWLSRLSLDRPGNLAVMLRSADQAAASRHGSRLLVELELMARQAPLQGQPSIGLMAWRDQLASYLASPQQARTPGRADIAYWLAHPRRAPRLEGVVSFGVCERPSWVEVWHPAGVARVPHRPGMTLDQALATAGEALDDSRPVRRLGDQAWLITPLGERHLTGIAAWNHQTLRVSPGSRILVPTGQTWASAAWVDEALPQFLASRLPGDACTLFTVDDLAPQ